MKAHEIKFRAWDKENACFWYSEKFGSLSKFFEYMENLEEQGNEITYQPHTGIATIDNIDIYPGDIFLRRMPFMGEGKHEKCIINYKDGTYYINNKGNTLGSWTKDLTKLGTIYENPELLDENGLARM